jgi:hypothetical protein
MASKKERKKDDSDVATDVMNYGVDAASSSWSNSLCIPETGSTSRIRASPQDDYLLISKVNTLNGCGQASLHN